MRGGENAGTVRSAPKGFWKGCSPSPGSTTWAMHWPYEAVPETLPVRRGELVCRALFQEPDPCSVSPSVTFAVNCNDFTTDYIRGLIGERRTPRPQVDLGRCVT
jgi:hypothetical protein